MRCWLAVRTFFRVLADGDFADGLREWADGVPPKFARTVDGAASGAATPAIAARTPAPPAAPVRSEAITLLATLQREARFVDMVSESLDAHSDAQIGAAARDVLRDSRKVLDRMFALRPVVDAQEGDAVDVPAGYDAGRFRLTGRVANQPPLRGQLVHAGWVATKCDLPAWMGSGEAALVVAPAEVQVG